MHCLEGFKVLVLFLCIFAGYPPTTFAPHASARVYRGTTTAAAADTAATPHLRHVIPGSSSCSHSSFGEDDRAYMQSDLMIAAAMYTLQQQG
jgi:hypothetical protein